ncbi:MAG TPA: LamG-like jellyroll fold domain-containing protein, partial [Segetibacter sp.]
LTNDAALQLSAFTLEAWVKPVGAGITTTSGSGGITAVPIITKGRSEADAPANINVNYLLGIDVNKKLIADFEQGSGTNRPVVGITSIPNNVWTHVAATYDPVSAVWKLYINGVLDLTKDLGSNITPANTSIQPAAIATAFTSTGVANGYFDGNIDEARIWNVVRTDAEILNNYKQELTSGTGLVARYGLNEGSGTTAANSISATSNGTLVNNPQWSDGFTIGNSDLTPPTVLTINRQSPATNPTSATSVTYRVTFSEKVTGVNIADFAATRVLGSVSGTVSTVTSITEATYDVTVSSTTGEGDLRLDLNPTGTGITDLAGNAINGGFTSGQTYTIQAASSVNQSLTFNGSNNYVSFGIADSSTGTQSLNLTTFTLEAWVKKEGTGIAATSGSGGITAYPVITKGMAEADAPSNLNMNYFLGVDQNGRLTADFEQSSGTNRPVVGATPIPDSVWTHVAVTYEPVSAVWKLYINGVLDNTKDLGSNIIPVSTSIQHAGIASALNSKGVPFGYFAGKIDEVRIWNIARTGTDILNS